MTPGHSAVPRHPGDRLRRFASRCVSGQAMERLIDPVIADLQCEHAAAIADGQRWRARWIRASGYVAFAKVLGLHASRSALPTTGGWTDADSGAIGRAIVVGSASAAVLTALFVYLPFQSVGSRITSRDVGWLVAYLVPQSLVVAVPFGLAAGVLFGLRPLSGTTRALILVLWAAMILSAAEFVAMGWVVPQANQEFRELVFHAHVSRGFNELSLGALRSRGAIYQFHQRLALSCTPLLFTLLAGSLSAWRRRWVPVPVGLVALTLYLVNLENLSVPQTMPVLSAWAPDLAMVVAASSVFALARRDRHLPNRRAQSAHT